MSYKGNDLNLRAPYARPAREADATEDDGAASPGWRLPRERGETIEVDHTLLACCNQAYDVAQFHGAREVRLEHLLHALTRVHAACDSLEQRGVRTSQLRRETAAAIASEPPPGAGGMKGVPRASIEVENVLRRAAARAAEDHVPASVADLVRALLHYGRDTPAAALLLRSAGDPQQLERWGEAVHAPEPPPSAPKPTAAPQSARPDMADALFARLDKMEASWRSLAAEVAADRRAMGEAVRELQRDLHAYRADDARLPAAGPGLDPAIERKLTEFASTVAAVAERLGAIDKLATGGGNLAALGARLEAIEGGMAAGVQRANEEGARNWSTAEERLTGLEAMVRAHIAQADEAVKSHERDLSEIFEALVKLGTNQQTLGTNLDTWRLDNSGDVSIVSNRLEQMERTTLETLGRLGDEIRSLRAPAFEGHDGEARGNGFKRWLYGTGRVFATGWRDEGDAARRPLPPVRDDGKA